MTPLLALIPLLAGLGLYASFVRLAAKMVRHATVSWRHALSLAAMGFAVGLLVSLAANLVFGQVGPVTGPLAGLACQTLLGGWFLGPRAHLDSGAPVRFRGGALIAALAAGALGLVSIGVTVVVPMLGGRP